MSAFIGLAAVCGLGFWLAGPWLDHRGAECAFYEAIGRRLRSDDVLALLYDDWDRDPYPTPFGAIPHDLAAPLLSATTGLLALQHQLARISRRGALRTLDNSASTQLSGNFRPGARRAGA